MVKFSCHPFAGFGIAITFGFGFGFVSKAALSTAVNRS